MRYRLKVKPRSRIDKVEFVNDSELLVKTKMPALEGKANQSVIKLLSEYFDVPKSAVTILKGKSSRNKVVEVENK